MKKFSKIKLNHLSKNALDARLQNTLKGGGTCYCSCSGCSCGGSWDGTGSMPQGSSTQDMGRGYGTTSSSLDSNFY
jgi:natural product precursor